MTVDTSELDRRIVIEKCELTKDRKLNEVQTWAEHYSCYAGIITSENNAEYEEGRTDYNTVRTFKVRYCAKASAVVPELYRIRYNGHLYLVKSSVDVNEAHLLIKIRAVIIYEQ
ncbi:MAG: phage head closure protein [Ruminococcus sp.]|nr:phage head closure protein [Ruminococcus sp.]